MHARVGVGRCVDGRALSTDWWKWKPVWRVACVCERVCVCECVCVYVCVRVCVRECVGV